MSASVPQNQEPATELIPHRVLLVDDEPAILRLVTHLLRKSGYEVASAGTAREALGFLRRFEFDCIITDAIMPDLTGFDFVKLVREDPKLAALPILMLTRNRTLQDVKKAVDLGVCEYILKPVDTQILLEKLEYCMVKTERPGGRFFELPLIGSHTDGVLQLKCQVRSIGETALVLETESRIQDRELAGLDLPVFREIGIEPPHLRRISSIAQERADGKTVYQDRYSFMGLSENELKKIRLWLQRESSRRRKT